MNKLTTDIFRSVYTKLDPKRRLHCMEVFGLDFMIDDEFKPYLIEVNTNPSSYESTFTVGHNMLVYWAKHKELRRSLFLPSNALQA